MVLYLLDLASFRHTYPHGNLDSINKKQMTLKIAKEEPALFHAALFHAALHLCIVRSDAPRTDLFYHHGEAIRLINERIGAVARDQKPTNALIAAVGCLTHFEVLFLVSSCLTRLTPLPDSLSIGHFALNRDTYERLTSSY